MRRFSLPRRSLCALLLVAVTAFSAYADLSSQQLQNLLNSIGSVYDIINVTQNNQGHSSAWYLQNIRDIIQNPMSDLQASAQSQSASLTSLLSELQAVRTVLESESSGFDDTDLLNGLNSLQSSLQTMQGYLASLDASVSAISSTNDASGLDLQGYFSQVIDALTNLQAVFDGSINVTGELTLGDGQASMIRNISLHTQGTQNAVFALTQHLDNFIGSPGDSLSDLNPGGNGAMSWHAFLEGFVDMFHLLEQQFEIVGYRLLLLTQYAERLDQDYMPSITNSLLMYLPFLTNQADDLFYPYFTNQLAYTPLFPSSPAWSYDPNAYTFGRLLGIILGQNYGFNGTQPEARTSLFQVPGQGKNFWTSGQIGPTALESHLYAWSEPSMNQRRWIYEISNTVPYIEGLPTRASALSDSGDGWLSAWGDLQWSSDNGTISLSSDGRARSHTPWNHGYFSTDYFADLLKFIAATNLLQNAYYGQRLLEALGQTNVISDVEDLPTMPELEPVTNVVSEMTPQNFFPALSDVEVHEMEVDELTSFDSDARSKIATALTISGTSSGSIVLFPPLPFLNNDNLSTEYRFDFADHFDSQDRELVRTIFSAIWHIVFYVFAVFKVSNTIQQFFSAS